MAAGATLAHGRTARLFRLCTPFRHFIYFRQPAPFLIAVPLILSFRAAFTYTTAQYSVITRRMFIHATMGRRTILRSGTR